MHFANSNDKLIHLYSMLLDEGGNYSFGEFNKMTSKFGNASMLIQNIAGDQDSILLAAGPDNNVLLFHHTKNFGGKLSCPDNKVVAIEGLKDQTAIFKINNGSFSPALTIPAPPSKALLDCGTAQEVRELNVGSATKTWTFKCSSFCIPPPLFAMAVLKTQDHDPFELISMLAKEAVEFDEAHVLDKKVVEKQQMELASCCVGCGV